MYCQRLLKLILCLGFFVSSANIFSTEENFLLIDGTTDKIVTEFGPRTDERVSPCSTFKIVLSLMGYDAEILKDEKTPCWEYQETYEDWLDVWKSSQSPQSWMQYSCVWYSKLLAKQLGTDRINSYLSSMKYGNMDISGGIGQTECPNIAWINSSLKISLKEQVEFLVKMIQEKLPTSIYSTQMTKAILFKEVLSEGWKLYGKTGWSGSDITKDGKTLEHSWFIGWIEKDYIFYPFAYLIYDEKINLDHRIPRVKQLLLESEVMTN